MLDGRQKASLATGRFCAGAAVTVLSSSNALTLVFRSDSPLHSAGFLALYRAVRPDRSDAEGEEQEEHEEHEEPEEPEESEESQESEESGDEDSEDSEESGSGGCPGGTSGPSPGASSPAEGRARPPGSLLRGVACCGHTSGRAGKAPEQGRGRAATERQTPRTLGAAHADGSPGDCFSPLPLAAPPPEPTEPPPATGEPPRHGLPGRVSAFLRQRVTCVLPPVTTFSNK